MRAGAVWQAAILGCFVLGGCEFDTRGLAPRTDLRVGERRPGEGTPAPDRASTDARREAAPAPDLRGPDLIPKPPDLPPGTCVPACGGATPICCVKPGSSTLACHATAEGCQCDLGNSKPCAAAFAVCCSTAFDLFVPRCHATTATCACDPFTKLPCKAPFDRCCRTIGILYECDDHPCNQR